MSKKGSLLSGSEFENIGRKRGGGGGGRQQSGMNTQDKVKVGVAAGLLVVAALLLAWNFGLLNFGGPRVEPVPPEVIQQWKEEQAVIQQQIDEGILPPPAGE